VKLREHKPLSYYQTLHPTDPKKREEWKNRLRRRKFKQPDEHADFAVRVMRSRGGSDGSAVYFDPHAQTQYDLRWAKRFGLVRTERRPPNGYQVHILTEAGMAWKSYL